MNESRSYKEIILEKNFNPNLELKVETNIPKLKRAIFTILYYPHPVNIFVSGDCENTVKLYDTQTSKKVHQYGGFTSWVLQLSKKDDDSFIAGGLDGNIKILRLKKPFKEIKSLKIEEGVWRCMKLDEKRILIRTIGNSIIIVEYSGMRMKKVMKFDLGGCSTVFQNFLFSKKYPNCFYYFTHTPFEGKLFDLKNDKIIKTFDEHGYHNNSFSFCLFHPFGNINNEILVDCVNSSFFSVYYTSDEKYNTNTNRTSWNPHEKKKKQLKDAKGGGNDRIRIPNCVVVENQYIVYGDNKGFLRIAEIDFVDEGGSCQVSKIRIIFEKRVHRQRINDLKVCLSEDKRVLRIATGGDDDRILLCSIRGLVFRSVVEDIDLVERIEFVKNETELYLFESKELLKKVFLKVKLLDGVIDGVIRCIL